MRREGKNQSILVAMSGGVDSSVAVHLLKEQGFSCAGATMNLYEHDDEEKVGDRSCCGIDDMADARVAASQMGIPYHVFDFTDEFRRFVIDPFIGAYEQGFTPNPCIECNRVLKFQTFLERARSLGYDAIATGHYVRREERDGRILLRKGLDPSKDQSYVLYMMTQEQLRHTYFPLGDLTKDQVRDLAAEAKLVNAEKHDSQDICFVPDGDYGATIEEMTGRIYPEGDFVDREGNVLGRHRGIIRYTLGQRKGLGLALPQPMYVMEKDLENNRIVLGLDKDLFSREFFVEGLNWIAWDVPPDEFSASVRVRYNQKEQPAKVYISKTDSSASRVSRIRVIFNEPQRAITPGQAAVFYEDDLILGGGTITEVFSGM